MRERALSSPLTMTLQAASVSTLTPAKASAAVAGPLPAAERESSGGAASAVLRLPRLRLSRQAVFLLLAVAVFLLLVSRVDLGGADLRQSAETRCLGVLEATADDDPASLPEQQQEELQHGQHRLHAQHRQRYLVYSPQFGFSNQMIAVRNMFLLAYMTDRVLVVPDVLEGMQGRGTARPFQELFRLDKVRMAFPQVIPMHEFLRLDPLPAPPRRIFFLSFPFRILQQRYEYLFGALRKAYGKDFSPLNITVPVHTAQLSDWAPLFGACKDEVLAVTLGYALLHNDHLCPECDTTMHKILPQIYQPQPRLEAITEAVMQWILRAHDSDDNNADGDSKRSLRSARELQSSSSRSSRSNSSPLWNGTTGRRVGKHSTALLPPLSTIREVNGAPYACAHVRRGDFHNTCRVYTATLMHSRGYACILSAGAVVRQTEELIKLHGLPRDTPIYVATDDQPFVNSVHARRLKAGTSVKKGGDAGLVTSLSRVLEDPDFKARFGEAIAGTPAHTYPLIDQMVCARSRAMILNRYSTFSRLIRFFSEAHHDIMAANEPPATGGIMGFFQAPRSVLWRHENVSGILTS